MVFILNKWKAKKKYIKCGVAYAENGCFYGSKDVKNGGYENLFLRYDN